MEETSEPGLNGLPLFSLFIIIAAVAILAAPGEAWAWGAGIHVAQGSFILSRPELIHFHVAAVIQAYPMDYIYGCISADIFIGKGFKRRDDHCHNWNVGMKILRGANGGPTQAYAYGYLTHLAADIIAHNYFIPNLLYSTPSSSRLGHVFWEFIADRFIKKKNWRLASKVVANHNLDNDTLVKKIMNRGALDFGAKKMMFKRAVQLTDIVNWRQEVEHALIPERIITRRRVATLNNYSLNLVVDLLCKGEDSICFQFDPVGTDNTIEAKSLRRSAKQQWKPIKQEAFPVPEAILALDYVDHSEEWL